MELKYTMRWKSCFVLASSNRTFMELKYFSSKQFTMGKVKVLIVPLWN